MAVGGWFLCDSLFDVGYPAVFIFSKICTKCRKYYDMTRWCCDLLSPATYIFGNVLWWQGLRSLTRYMSCSHRALRRTECFSVVKACSRCRAINWESCLTITCNILCLVMVLLSLICTPFSFIYIYIYIYIYIWFQHVLQEDIFIVRKIPYILKDDWILSIFGRSEILLPHSDMYTSCNMF